VPPASEGLTDLPPILPWWGPDPWRARQKANPGDANDDTVLEIRYRDLFT
jgi:hypothetical protein